MDGTAQPPMTATPSTRRVPAATTSAYAAWRIFDLSVGQMLWSRRTIFMGLIVGAFVALSGVIRALFELGAPFLQRGSPGPMVFGLVVWGFVRFVVPVLAVFYGTALIADEVDDKTITYLFTRPIPRGAVLVGKYLAYLACSVCVVIPAVLLCWLLVYPMGADLARGFIDVLRDLAVLSIGLAAYGALFAWVGATFARPLVFGLVFVFGWEGFVLALPGYLKRFTVEFYLQGLVPHALPSDSPMGLLQAVFRESPSWSTSLLCLSGIVAAALWLAARNTAQREYVLEQ